MSLVDLGKRLLEAAKLGQTDEVRTLMSNGAPFTTDWLGTSPLHFAAQGGHVDTAEVLLRAGISRDARTKVDRTPLHIAAQEGRADIVSLLLRHGADVEAKDMLKMTPLHWAVEKCHIRVIELLLEHSADISCENKFDRSPVDIALSIGRTDIADMLQMSRENTVEITTDPTVIEEVTTTEQLITTEIPAAQVIQEMHVPKPQPVALMKINKIEPQDTSSASTLVATTTSNSEESPEQSSTAVLATLAALAEATAPLDAANTSSTTAAEALNWLETHGITMISDTDTATIVTSSIENGQTLALTEAGKLALNFVRQENVEQTQDVGDDMENHMTACEEEVVTETTSESEDAITKKVITIVSEQTELSPASSPPTPVVVTIKSDSCTTESGSGEPAMKKVKVVTATQFNSQLLRQQLEQAQRQAEQFKEQLRKKEHEAELYKRQLTEIAGKSSTQ
ncbi:hypothetical protein NP493_407g05030 [Ridgeia piscesae]|uniref:GA-binding protein subunit beta-1 n=1 Tax=Ridgeia piscesae TaxID=27915 RepID=A0AAD9L183_RIDPI|nr:hypothetical protein NP493_407g05030 [Ridgeia piscesae]